MGSTCSLGEVNFLGYARAFPPTLVGGFGSGTGMAGPFGSGVYLALVALGTKDIYVFAPYHIDIYLINPMPSNLLSGFCLAR